MTGEGERAVERLRRLYAGLAEGDFSADIEIYDRDIEVIWAEGMADSTVDRGARCDVQPVNGGVPRRPAHRRPDGREG
jgi:hypothetical protein